MDWSSVLWLVLIWVISAIPLNIAVKLLGGRSSLMKAIFVNLIVALLVGLITGWLGASFIASVLGFIALLFVYKVMFRMGWLRCFLAWLLQFVLVAIVIIVLALLGLSLILL